MYNNEVVGGFVLAMVHYYLYQKGEEGGTVDGDA